MHVQGLIFPNLKHLEKIDRNLEFSVWLIWVVLMEKHNRVESVVLVCNMSDVSLLLRNEYLGFLLT